MLVGHTSASASFLPLPVQRLYIYLIFAYIPPLGVLHYIACDDMFTSRCQTGLYCLPVAAAATTTAALHLLESHSNVSGISLLL